MPQKYPQSFWNRAIRLVLERLEDDDKLSPYRGIGEVAPKLGVLNEALHGLMWGPGPGFPLMSGPRFAG